MMVKVNSSFCLRRNKQPASRRRRPKQAAHLLFSPKHPMEALLSALVRACERAFTEADFSPAGAGGADGADGAHCQSFSAQSLHYF